MTPPLLSLQDIALGFGGRDLLAGASLSVQAGDRLCLVGRNGSGKSTLLKIAAGALAPDRGSRFVQPGMAIGTLPQEPDFAGFANARAYVEAGLPTRPDEPVDHHRAEALLDALGLSGDAKPDTLSGGEARRCALARALVGEPDILLLDEPTNHLDLPAIEWLERTLAALRAGIVLISHDRRLLERVTTATVWLDRGLTRRRDAGYAGFEAWRDEVLEQETRETHKLERKIAREEDWMRYGVTARRKRNVRRVAELAALRSERRSTVAALGTARLAAADASVSGRLVIAADAVEKSFGARTLVRGLTTRVLRGDRVGIVGPNGAGKTTLLQLLTGVLTPDAGEIRLGAALQQVVLDQRRTTLDPARTLADTLTDGGGDWMEVQGERRHVIGAMKDYLFTPEQARTSVGRLSGGERARVTLARAFAKPSNLLVLDEPTNDLDLETLELLQEKLADYGGTVLLVSHDRDFLDRVATAIIAAEGDGRWTEYAGGYSDMLAQRGPVASPQAPRPRPLPDPAKPRVRSPAQERLSYKERHALQHLPSRIAQLEATRERLTASLADPDLYANDPARFARTTTELAGTERDLSAAEDEWLTLELRRAEIEGAAAP